MPKCLGTGVLKDMGHTTMVAMMVDLAESQDKLKSVKSIISLQQLHIEYIDMYICEKHRTGGKSNNQNLRCLSENTF